MILCKLVKFLDISVKSCFPRISGRRKR